MIQYSYPPKGRRIAQNNSSCGIQSKRAKNFYPFFLLNTKVMFTLYRIAFAQARKPGHVGGQEQKHFSSLGTKLYFHVNSSRKKILLVWPQHGRLVTWLQTKNTR